MPNLKPLTILHSNDMHGDFLVEKKDERLVGGVSMLSGYVNLVREKEKNVIYCIAGDMFRGSVIDSEYRGISTIEIMNRLSPDVVTLGNHEFDYGVSHLLFIEKCAKFPIINANLYIKTNHARLFTPCLTIEIDGMNILFIGIITQEIIAQAKSDELVGTIIDTADAANTVEQICNSYKGIDVDFTVLLTHIGFDEDIKLANMLNPDCGVDVIIGGHSHTILEKPYEANGILIAQAGVGTDQIGRFDILVNTDTNSVHSYEWELVPIDNTRCPRDKDLEDLITTYNDVLDLKYKRLVTKFKKEMTHPQRNTETALGNLLAEIVRESLSLDIMMMGSGSIRKTALGPVVEFGALSETLPYDDQVFLLILDGKTLKKALLYTMRDDRFAGHTECFQFSKGFRMVYDRDKKEITDLCLHGVPIADDRRLSVGLQTFHFNNTETSLGLTMQEISVYQKPRAVAVSIFGIILEYLENHNLLTSEVEGRITIIGGC
ncbi:MAG: bifunctional metallophosphatase/5'-nucleotidase [Candidatus Methanomethylophilaceae archaeon]|nr:bifunctional metallophosphatase/5'-nucleotidase [Candidatus Methanomethylophilaceae archaeon]